MKHSLLNLIKNFPSDIKLMIKNIYKDVNDLKIVDWENVIISDQEFDFLIDLLKKINNNEDITLDLGYKYFRNNKLVLKKGIFIPQFDTEKIIDLVKEKITEGKFLEIGVGTGAISLSLISETKMRGIGIDINQKAIELANKNLKNLKLDESRISFLEKNFFEIDFKEKFDLIISNPPYISINDKHVDQWVKENQPKEALYANDNGLAFYKKIFNKVPSLLLNNGYIILEIGYDQGELVKNLALEITTEVEVIKDYENHDRFIVARYNGK